MKMFFGGIRLLTLFFSFLWAKQGVVVYAKLGGGSMVSSNQQAQQQQQQQRQGRQGQQQQRRGSITTETEKEIKIIRDKMEEEEPSSSLPRLHIIRSSSDVSGGNQRRKPQRNLQELFGELEMHGGNPDDFFIPLGLCEGDCDEDWECEEGLVCFQRDGGVPVPGCLGEDKSKSDYCIKDPNDDTSSGGGSQPKPAPQPTRQPSPRPTRRPSPRPSPQPTPRPNPPRPTPNLSLKPPTARPPTNPSSPSTLPKPSRPFVIINKQATEYVDLVGNNGMPLARFPLHMCQGDCDSDEECGNGLICFRRNAGDDVPGCLGGLEDKTSVDYCIQDPSAVAAPAAPVPKPTTPNPPTPRPQPRPTAPRPPRPTTTPITASAGGGGGGEILPELDIVGNNGWPKSRFPLGRCQGDCDFDEECRAGLICFRASSSGTTIPGCKGTAGSGDFCVVDTLANTANDKITTTPPPTDKPVVRPPPTPPRPPVSTINKPRPRPTPRPTPFPTHPPTKRPTRQPTIALQQPKELSIEKDIRPLGLCQGDCDEDGDCAGTMICYQRGSLMAVPGCIGGDEDGSRSDYCVLDRQATPSPTPNPTRFPTRKPTRAPTNFPTPRPTNPPTTPSPTPRPTRAPTTRRPTRSPTHAPVRGPTPTPTRRPTRRPTRTIRPRPTPLPTPRPTNTPTRSPTRKPTAPPTPQPTNPLPTPAPTPKPVPAPFHNVRLRLYWEEGYTWQESTKERFWCMMADYRGKPGTGRCWHGQYTKPCSRDEMYVATCNNDKRQRFSIMFLTADQVMFKVTRDNRCFQRNGQLIQLRPCDPTNDLQHFFSRRGAFFQRRFEISPASLPEYCATQEHHPKPGEQVYFEPCVLSRHPYHQSNFWQRW